MEFKGTKGKWYLQEYTDDYTNIIRVKTDISDTIFLGSSSQNPKPEYRANALLISKAPEMLEMLKEVIEFTKKVQAPSTSALFLRQEIEQLIKEATEI